MISGRKNFLRLKMCCYSWTWKCTYICRTIFLKWQDSGLCLGGAPLMSGTQRQGLLRFHGFFNIPST